MKKIENSPFSNIFQACAVVRDANATAHRLTSLGLGPFKQLPYNAKFAQTQFRGKTIEGGAIIMAADAGGVELELIQPLGGPSAWTEFLEQKGEGLHHICFRVDSLEKAKKNAEKVNLKVIQSFTRPDGGGFAYLDSDKVGGVIFELSQRPAKKTQ